MAGHLHKSFFEKEYGEQITESEAQDKLIRLVELLRAILKGAEIAILAPKDQNNKKSDPSFIDEQRRNDKLKE